MKRRRFNCGGLRPKLEPMTSHRRPALLIALLLAGCAGTGERLSWHLDTAETAPAAPVALYGRAESEADLVLECLPAARAIAFRTVDVDPFEGTRPIRIRVGLARFEGSERLEAPDGIPIARAVVPIDAPVVAALAEGRSPIAITVGRRTGRIPNGPEVARMVRDCRAMMPRG